MHLFIFSEDFKGDAHKKGTDFSPMPSLHNLILHGKFVTHMRDMC